MPNSGQVAIIGGGLAGLLVALRLERNGINPILIENPLPNAQGRLGGFAKFSGAKFSLPPAGKGLASIAESENKLLESVRQVLDVLALTERNNVLSGDVGIVPDESLNNAVAFRRYRSIILTPVEVDSLIDRLTHALTNTIHIRGLCSSITRKTGKWHLIVKNDLSNRNVEEISVDTVFYAAGRNEDGLLTAAGAVPQNTRGLDVGFRAEFSDKSALDGLRKLGPDAKLIMGACRTFCLNHPGEVYRYQAEGLSIPGGVVAESSAAKANVGILFRSDTKADLMNHIKLQNANLVKTYPTLSISGVGVPTSAQFEPLRQIYPDRICRELAEFSHELSRLKAVDWSCPYEMHFPLIDWHWPIYGLPKSFKSSLKGVFVVGDSAGHARGLLQAAVSGWMAAEEYLS